MRISLTTCSIAAASSGVRTSCSCRACSMSRRERQQSETPRGASGREVVRREEAQAARTPKVLKRSGTRLRKYETAPRRVRCRIGVAASALSWRASRDANSACRGSDRPRMCHARVTSRVAERQNGEFLLDSNQKLVEIPESPVNMAGVLDFEPGLTESEFAGLPLTYSPATPTRRSRFQRRLQPSAYMRREASRLTPLDRPGDETRRLLGRAVADRLVRDLPAPCAARRACPPP